ncbi:hypothetical protein ACMZYS_07615, partial [Pseudomonas syringae pv. actinidiae]|uniref:hypothetical protein n=1 Tax=Pseudomonas syringae TaxID=317 RepID=UPI0039EF83CC
GAGGGESPAFQQKMISGRFFLWSRINLFVARLLSDRLPFQRQVGLLKIKNDQRKYICSKR